MDEFVDGIRCLTGELSTLLEMVILSQEDKKNSEKDVEESSTSDWESETTKSWSNDSVTYSNFPVTDDTSQCRDRSTMPGSDDDRRALRTVRATASIAEELVSESDGEEKVEQRKVIDEYRKSVDNLMRRYETVSVNISCDRCRRQFCSSAKDLSGALQQLVAKCSTVRNAGTHLIEKFRNNTVESFNIVSKLEQQIRCYNQTEPERDRSTDSSSEVRSTMELLRSFYEAFTYVTGVVTAMIDANPEPEMCEYLKQRSAELGKSTSKMIIYIESRLLYNFLYSKIIRIERAAEEANSCRVYELTELLQIMAHEAKELTLTFKKLVNHFDMKRNSKTSGELIRSSFSLEKSARTFVFNVKKTEFLVNAKYNYDKGQLKMGYVKEFTENVRATLNLFLMEINKIVKAST